ncbi:MAG: hypothetical protein IKP47_05750 [Ruminococcus sp.]|nr:hypothetical protein [Ruminococcus sp.]
MADRKIKKAITFALVLSMMMPLGSMAASSTEDAAEQATADSAAETADTADSGEAEEPETGKKNKLAERITDEEAVALCEEVASNEYMKLYMDSKNDRWGVYVIKSGTYLWSSPINVKAEDGIVDTAKNAMMKDAKRKQIGSSAAIKVADLRQEKRSESPAPDYSTKAAVKYSKENGGFAIRYNYKGQGVEFTMHVTLEDDHVYAYVDTVEIQEANTSTTDGKILTKLQIAPAFGAVAGTDNNGDPVDGYMIVPDGSGAVINYNNGKTNYSEYSQLIYGRDYTPVPLNAPRVTEQAYMPVMASVSGNNGFVAVVSDGDAFCYAKAKVSGQDSQVYNNCYFEFEVRSSDSFFMSGDNSNKINVFEKGDIKTDRFGIKYYPISNSEGINYADCAAVYRNYLIKEKGLTSKVTSDYNKLYLDLYGGVLKRTSILGLPFNLKTEITGFDQAGEILQKLKDLGVDETIVDYNDWTNKSIKQTISTSASASGTLGGNGDFEDLRKTAGTEIFGTMDNFMMKSGTWGYLTFSNTATRISNEYSRQVEYSPAFGVALKGVAPALVAPRTYEKIFDEMIESYKDEGINAIGFGRLSSKLVSDFSTKSGASRNDAMNILINGYSKAASEVGSVICDGANAFLLPYASQVTDVPVYSSGFNITDYDIPFYQMVVHGYVPYSTKPINASSNTGETFMLGLAAGSAIHYDMTYEEAATLQDTDYDVLYYSNYEGWIEMAADQYKIADELLSPVSDMIISKYEISEDGNVLTTTYSKDGKNVVVEIDKANAVAKIDGKTIDMAHAIEGGVEG